MAQVTVTIRGASRGATLSWNHQLVPLTNPGGGIHTAAFQAPSGQVLYAIVVFGSPSDPWTASVSDGVVTHNHAGHMSPAGFDTTGDTLFQVH